MHDTESSHFTKVIFCGDSTVGKSTMIQRIVEGEARHVQNSTMGAAFYSSKHLYKDTQININFWDTAGQEEYRSLVNIYFRSVDIVIVVFDLSKPKTFESVEDWIDEATENAGQSEPNFIVGNKEDLECKVSIEKINNIKAKYKYVQTSAINGDDVNTLINMILETALEREKYKDEMLKNEKEVDLEVVKNDKPKQNKIDKPCC